MSDQQLALPAPWGFADGYSVSLMTRTDMFHPFDPERAKVAIMKFGCPARIADKAVSCLQASDRYDCVLNPALMRYDGDRLRGWLREAGIDLAVNRRPNLDEPGMEERKMRQLRDQVRTPNSQYNAIMREEDARGRRINGPGDVDYIRRLLAA